MSFQESFLRAIRVNRMAALSPAPTFLIPNLYHYSPQESLPGFLRLLGGGAIHTDTPVSFSFSPMDCHLLLLTKSGGGRIAACGSSITLTDGQLLYFNCRHPFTLQSILVPWHFKLFFITGAALGSFDEQLRPDPFPHLTVPEVSPLYNDFSSLLSITSSPSQRERFLMHRDLTDILTTFCISQCTPEAAAAEHIPAYLTEMRDFIEHHYMEAFSLNTYENLFQISKYRLCREFSGCFGVPPLRCLTQKRLSKAKEMLLTTDWTVHEISSKVGYDNVNHFINLFKKENGTTPRVFRQTALAARFASHSSPQ